MSRSKEPATRDDIVNKFRNSGAYIGDAVSPFNCGQNYLYVVMSEVSGEAITSYKFVSYVLINRNYPLFYSVTPRGTLRNASRGYGELYMHGNTKILASAAHESI